MSSNSVESSENICVVCFKKVDIYSIGNCDHMVCFECSTRMRVLCRQNECPICRQDLPKVVFAYTVQPFSVIVHSAPFEDKKFKILFQDKKIQDTFYKLLEHHCSVCQNNPTFKTFQHLYDHMRREHELYYCDLCVQHLKIFTSEMRCYTKAELSQHKRKGDVDDRSHRGHPLCEFCQVRYMDNDSLYRHLRKDHLFCHFCDADGHDLYYSSYDYLHDHFRQEHYLCEEGRCLEEKFTTVFRTEIDLKAHRMSEHGRTMGKAAAKQARTLELEFTLKPRPRQDDSRKGKSARFVESSALEGASGVSEEPPRMHSPTLDPSEFPSLPSGSGSTVTVSAPQRRNRTSALTIQAIGRRNAPLVITDEDFPVLGDYNDSAQGTSVRLNINQDISNTSGRSGSMGAPRNVSIHVNHRRNGEPNIRIRQDEFPALSSESSTSTIPKAKWVSVANKKSTSNPPPKQTKQTSLLDGDFPGLNSKFNSNLNLKANEPLKPNYVKIRSSKGEGKDTKKASSVTIPVGSEWSDASEVGTSNSKSKVKKKKSKGNNNEEKSDTAKKKDDKETNNRGKGNSDKAKSNSCALLENSSNTVVKSLPTVEDWFGIGKNKKQQSKAKGEEERGETEENNKTSSRVNNKVSSAVSKPSSTKLKSDPDGSSTTNLNKKVVSRKTDSKPPPGFDHLNGFSKTTDTSKPPPGFSFDFPQSNGLTFTNSSGQSFAIHTNYNYTPPLNFEKRNQNLVTKVFQILLNDGNLEQFKRMSALFRQDMLSADEYCNHCIKTMGENGFKEIFPELVILLPDINKQQELFQVFARSKKFDVEKTRLQSCETCRQVLCVSDVKEHLAQHTLQENFPLLLPNSWTK